MLRARIGWTLATCLCLLAIGCTERKMVITSEPEGAKVVVNNTWVGTTPMEVTFKHYGVYGIRLEKEGYYPMFIKEPIAQPLYERPGIDLVNAALVPKRIVDLRQLHYVMEKVEEEDGIDGIIARSEEMGGRMEKLAAQQAERDKQRKPPPSWLPLKKKDKDESDEQPESPPAETEPAAPEEETPPEPEPHVPDLGEDIEDVPGETTIVPEG